MNIGRLEVSETEPAWLLLPKERREKGQDTLRILSS